MVLNVEQSNLHEGESAAEDGPNLSSILGSDPLWIAPSRECLLSEGEYSENMEVVTYLFSADPPADLAEKSSATPKSSGEADSLSPVSQVGLHYDVRHVWQGYGSRGGAAVCQSPLLNPLSGRHNLPPVVA